MLCYILWSVKPRALHFWSKAESRCISKLTSSLFCERKKVHHFPLFPQHTGSISICKLCESLAMGGSSGLSILWGKQCMNSGKAPKTMHVELPCSQKNNTCNVSVILVWIHFLLCWTQKQLFSPNFYYSFEQKQIHCFQLQNNPPQTHTQIMKKGK